LLWVILIFIEIFKNKDICIIWHLHIIPTNSIRMVWEIGFLGFQQSLKYHIKF
jgi:hypothetical protein